ncbi:hypothetical protein DPMN_109543 [Dreissena polymorpha]|uniref:Uncharacterized protein n=1 Tax=Dreissena polymorpha TaxID=45954 RepID=A0A9D4QM37_DREPO|nr:hypothetical protein DPMN_109543 [Dreissena polymorpha]
MPGDRTHRPVTGLFVTEALDVQNNVFGSNMDVVLKRTVARTPSYTQTLKLTTCRTHMYI